ncbi:putative protein PTGES3L isoform X2 [Eleutherodactylus coqui]|uniref:putative protein PTGES3L isoform X2 n=1 Tax=Eleutherodactylus coqui TaxID=57060 RepID=UPI00346208DF
MRQPAKVLWYDRASCLNEDNIQMYNEIVVYDRIQSKDSRERRSDRSITCFLRKWKEKVAWPRLTKDNQKPGWLFVDFDNWRDWDTEEEAEMALTEHYMDMINNVKEKGAPPSMDDLDDLDFLSCFPNIKAPTGHLLHRIRMMYDLCISLSLL